MDVLVKGMKMPKSCGRCPMMRPGNYKGQAFPCTCHAKDCFPIKPSELDLRDGLCPLVELHTPHGDLIDRDILLSSENQHYEIHSDSYYVETRTIELAPIIIGAEGE